MRVPDDIETRILDKAGYVEEAVTVLSEKQSIDEESYRSDREARAVVEREFQTAIEACIDIAGLLISVSNVSMPETNAGRFRTLEDIGVLSAETSARMRQAAGFRNVLTHTYGNDIDNAEEYRHLQNELVWLVRFLREVKVYIENGNG